MLIGNNYKIESDSMNIIVFEKKTITGKGHGKPTKREIGEEYWNPVAYFATVKNALNYLVEQGVKDTVMKDFRTIANKVDELRSIIARLPFDNSSAIEKPSINQNHEIIQTKRKTRRSIIKEMRYDKISRT